MSIQVIAIAATVASVAMSGVSAYMGAQARKSQAKYNAQVAANNAQVAEWAAEKELEEGERQVQEHFRKVAAMRGKQKTLLAAGGADVTFGTAADLLEDTQIMGDADAAIIKTNARMRAWERGVQATNSRAQSQLFSSQADNINPALDAGGAVLSGAASGLATGSQLGWFD